MLARLSGLAPLILLLSAVALACGGAVALALTLDLPSAERDFNLPAWEVRHLPGKWLYAAGRLLRGGLSEDEKEARLRRFLDLNAEIADLERRLAEAEAAGGDPAPTEAALRQRRHERDRLENDAEAVLEERVAEVASDLGLESSLPLLPDLRWLFPPVDAEFDGPPQVLALSPRDRIFLESERPLRADLTLEEVLRLEEEEEKAGDVSALVTSIGGASTYPSVVRPSADYEGILELVAHEWLHQYLFFRPLGRRYLQSQELTTLNETVASMAGGEMADLVARRYPMASLDAAPEGPATEGSLDVGRELRTLRLEVERLLDEGKIEEAEALMEERRRYLEEQGVYIRKINQAYFAYHGIYADAPASISPIGPKLAELRRRSPSLGEFIRAAAGLTSEADLDRLLAGEAPAATRP